MHKDIKVLKIEIGKDNQIKRIIDTYDFKHMPFASKDLLTLKKWWNERSIPLSRDEYKNITKSLPNDDSLSLVVKSHALSLNDQYWIKKEDEFIIYDDISFFSNAFDEDIGNALFGKLKKKRISYYSPDSTSIGNLKKRWLVVDGKKCLLKAGTKPYQYEIFSEIIASKIMDILNINHIPYRFYKTKDNIYCLSENFISYNEDFVSAHQLYNSKKKDNKVSSFEHLLSIYDELNIPNYRCEIDKMFFIDFLIGNIDRHLNNFGVIRDAKTLEFIRVAPIYDSGSSFGFDKTDDELASSVDIDWKPFKSRKFQNQLELLKDIKWLNINKLKSVVREVSNLLDEYQEYISKQRKNAIMTFLVRRINYAFAILNIDEYIEYSCVELTILEKQIIKYVEDNQSLVDLKELATSLDVSYITIYRAVANLTKNNILRRVGARKKGYWILVDRL